MKIALRVLYCLPLPGLPLIFQDDLQPTDEEVEEADCVLCDAFGRDSLRHKQMMLRLDEIVSEANIDSENPDLILAMQLLDTPNPFKDGPSNLAIAQEALHLFEQNPKLQFLANWEIGHALYKLDPTWFKQQAEAGRLFCTWATTKRGKYYATWLANQAMTEYMREQGLKKAILISHQDMAIRAALIRWREGIPVQLDLVPIPYDPQSVYWWCRNPYIWFPREIVVRLHHALKKIVAFKPPT